MASDYDLIILLLVEENFVVIVESLVDKVSNSGIINIASDPDLKFWNSNSVQPSATRGCIQLRRTGFGQDKIYKNITNYKYLIGIKMKMFYVIFIFIPVSKPRRLKLLLNH